MQHVYDPFIFRRMAEGRIFWVNASMPFEYFLDCFQYERPFFCVSHLDDGRIAITPNSMFLSLDYLQGGYGPRDLLPSEYEYVTVKNGTYPLIITAHPVTNVENWLGKFERWVRPFAKQTLSEFARGSFDFQPLKIPAKFETPVRTARTEVAPVNA